MIFYLLFNSKSDMIAKEVGAMLLQVRIKNYRSIGDEIILDMAAGNGRDHPNFLHEKNGVKILPIAAIYGSNASGKSNIIKAISAIIFNIKMSHTYGEKDFFLTTPYLYNDTLVASPTEFEIFIVIGDVEFQYGFIATINEIIEEWLYTRKMSKHETKHNKILERKNNEFAYINKYKKFNEFDDLITKKTLALSFIGNKNINHDIDFSNLFKWFNFAIPSDYDSAVETNTISQVYFNNKDFKNKFIKFINEFDSSIDDIIIKENKDENGIKKYAAYTKHGKNEYPFEIESDGTKKLYRLFVLFDWLLTLRSGLLIYDELDINLHPLILRRIVNMFHDKEINKMGSQLIFTSHNLIVLDRHELRRDEIWFAEKDKRGFTNLYSLDAFKIYEKAVRSDMDFSKNYLAGRFGAIPFLNNSEEN